MQLLARYCVPAMLTLYLVERENMLYLKLLCTTLNNIGLHVTIGTLLKTPGFITLC